MTPDEVPSPVASEELAVQAAAGDREALAQLFTRHDPQVFAYVLRRVRTKAVADDVTGEVWVRVASAIRRYVSRGDGTFVSWLFTIARRLVLNHYRSSGRRPSFAPEMLLVHQPSKDAGPAEVAEGQARAEEVTAALEGLTVQQRQCLTLRYYEGLSEQETADAMGQTVGSVKLLHHRAKKALRRALEP